MKPTTRRITFFFLLLAFAGLPEAYCQDTRLDLKLNGGGWNNTTLSLHLNIAIDQNTTGNMEVTGYGYDLAGTNSPIVFSGRALLWSNEYVYLWLKGQRAQEIPSDSTTTTFSFVYYSIEVRIYTPAVYDPLLNVYLSILSDSDGKTVKRRGRVEIM